MATWTGLEHTREVLNAANEWKDSCLLGDGSVFTNENLWTRQNISELKTLYVENLNEGGGNFYERLQIQISGARPEIYQLAAEVNWLLLLFIYKDYFGPEKKRERISEIWINSDKPFPESHRLTDTPLLGLANPGTAYLTLMWREFKFLLIVMENWKSLPRSQQDSLIKNNPWELCHWVTSREGGDRRMFRHVFLYFCYPDNFEKICSKSHKEQIYLCCSHMLQGESDPYKKDRSLCCLDEAILEIRKVLEEKYGTDELDFYREPLDDLWSYANKPTPDVTPPMRFTHEMALEDLFIDLNAAKRILTVWRSKKNLVLQGPPGVGKTFAARRLAVALIGNEAPDQIGFVQFHQSYSYEDFIQGYRPTTEGFELRNGRFFDFCRQAAENDNETYVFIIDEINRGNMSKIFGELMLLIEADKRGPQWEMPLAYSEASEKFFVPENVYLLGLMNTADRSLAVVDYALRRRFGFIDLRPQYESSRFQKHLKNNGISNRLINLIKQQLGDLNREIEGDQNLGRGFCIGHSFFCGTKDESLTEDDWYQLIIETEILPLLEEYWFDSPSRIATWRGNLLSEV